MVYLPHIVSRRAGKDRGGFTLIEVIVVVTILGILAVVAAPQMGCLTYKASQGAALANLNIIREAIRMKREAASAVGGYEGAHPLLGATDFRDGKLPLNTLVNMSAIDHCESRPEAAAISWHHPTCESCSYRQEYSYFDASNTYGWWYVTSGPDAGLTGAYDNRERPGMTVSW